MKKEGYFSFMRPCQWMLLCFLGVMVSLPLFAVSALADDTDTEYIEVSSPEEIVDQYTDHGSMLTQYEISSDSEYVTKRIILMGIDDIADQAEHIRSGLLSDLSVENVVTYANYDEVIFTFASEDMTKQAYERLTGVYGSEKCFLDEVIHADDMVLEDSNLADSYIETDTASELVSADAEETKAGTNSGKALSWGVSAMGMDQLKSEYVSDSANQVTVAVLDTGINQDNAIFSGRNISGYNTMMDSADYSEIVDSSSKDGHGTSVCGIICDATGDSVNLLVVGIFDTTGSSSQLAVITAFEYALENGADVINFSAGYRNSTMDYLDSMIDTLYKAGVPVITASGNLSQDVSGIYPASNEETIAVSGLKSVESTEDSVEYISSDTVAFDDSYSDFGEKIDFCAPGTNISCAADETGDAYDVKSGTSFAAPHITAACAWLKLLYHDESVSELYSRLESYCVDLGSPGKDELYGNGCPVIASLLDDVGDSGKETDSTSDASEQKQGDTDTSGHSSAIETGTGKSGDTDTSGHSSAIETGTGENGSSGSGTSSKKIKKPSKTRIIYAKRRCLRSIRLRWKKVSGVSGYQICYSTSKHFLKNKKYLTIKGAKNTYKIIRRLKRHKKFYLRVRSYKIVNHKKYYSGWSNVRTVRTR